MLIQLIHVDSELNDVGIEISNRACVETQLRASIKPTAWVILHHAIP
jgi:hypothetical protein